MRNLPHRRAPVARSALGLVMASGFALADGAQASTLLVSAGDLIGGQSVAAGSVLTVELDSVDRVAGVALVGEGTAPTGLGGLASGSDGALYATTEWLGGFAASELFELDPLTGAAVANLGTVNDGTNDLEISDLDFDPLSGLLFGTSSFETVACAACLYAIDTGTALATQIGVALPGVEGIEALAFTPDGTLYVVAITRSGATVANSLLTLDPTSADILTSERSTIDPAFGGASTFGFSGLGARPEDGVLFAVQRGGSPDLFRQAADGTWGHMGEASLDGPVHVSDLTFQSVPEPTRLALLLLVAGVTLAGRPMWRSRRTPSPR